MAAAFFNYFADPTKAEAISAGTKPGLRVPPEVLAVMQEIGIDLRGVKPRKLTEELAREAQLLITMGCGGQVKRRSPPQWRALPCLGRSQLAFFSTKRPPTCS